MLRTPHHAVAGYYTIRLAAGGVGMAALQVARLVGAEVYDATANRPKWAVLEALDVAHVFGSRSLMFADETMRRSEGRGMHVVLNSLHGPFVTRGMEILATGGVSLNSVSAYFQSRRVVSCESLREWGLRFGRLFSNALKPAPALAG